LRIGIHTSTAGSLEKAALKAGELGANTFQIFTSSPRMWKSRMPGELEIRMLRMAREHLDLAPLVVHDSYLINLAACEEEIRRKSIEAFRDEIRRCLAIGADYLVAHPGSCKGQTPDQAIASLAEAVAEAAKGLTSSDFMLLWENTAGAGNALGGRFDELAEIAARTQERVNFRVGYCLDTCHCLVSGYDVSTAKGLAATVKKAQETLGLHNVKVIHANDSKGRLGSRLDRHANIGEGHIGEEGFRRILTHPDLKTKPFILETPVDNEGDDLRNVEALKRLCRKSRTITKKSS
jgi:deoxyribonuclease-4